jgi:hypothetical protein
LAIKRIVFRIAEQSIPFPLAAYVDLGDSGFPPRLHLEQRGRLGRAVFACEAEGALITFRGIPSNVRTTLSEIDFDRPEKPAIKGGKIRPTSR